MGQDEEQEPECHPFMSGFSLLGSGPGNPPLIKPLCLPGQSQALLWQITMKPCDLMLSSPTYDSIPGSLVELFLLQKTPPSSTSFLLLPLASFSPLSPPSIHCGARYYKIS